MSSGPITVVLNTNQTKKFAVLLRSSDELSLKGQILREARNKFRSKALSIVFLQGGADFGDDDVLDGRTGLQVWVSKGEPYTGPPASAIASAIASGTMATVRVIAQKSFVDAKATQQLSYVAALPGVRLAVGMPDLHPGSRFPIGCALAVDGVYPALIGSDIGCGIAVYRLARRRKPGWTATRLAGMLRGLDAPWDGDVGEWLERYGVRRTSEFDQASLGTVGAGNHFAEICEVERIVDAVVAEDLGIREGGLYLLVHTGSRGLGSSILATQTATESNPYIPPDSPHLISYLSEHDYAVQWAIANRDLVAHRVKRCIFPPSPDTVTPSMFVDDDEADMDWELGKIVDVTHNSVTRATLNIDGEPTETWVHRKGAAPADKGIAPCPGSRGDFSWLLQPQGNGELNALSLAHGAGRRYGRQALHGSSKPQNKSSLTTTALGSEIVCTDPDLLVEERPEAYKDVKCVVEDMEDAGVVRGVVVLRPVVSYKVREAGERRG